MASTSASLTALEGTCHSYFLKGGRRCLNFVQQREAEQKQHREGGTKSYPRPGAKKGGQSWFLGDNSLQFPVLIGISAYILYLEYILPNHAMHVACTIDIPFIFR